MKSDQIKLRQYGLKFRSDTVSSVILYSCKEPAKKAKYLNTQDCENELF